MGHPPVAFAVGFAAAVIAATIGGRHRQSSRAITAGAPDNVIMRGVDMLMAFPYILLALAIVAASAPA